MIRPNLKNAAAAAGRVVKAAVTGKEVFVDERVEFYRLRACQRCPHRQDDQCKLCTCFIDAKAMLATEDCPDGRWNLTKARR